MDSRANITNIEIVTKKNTKILTESEIKKFCDEKVQISVMLVDDGLQRIRDCRVVLNRIHQKYIQNALTIQNNKKSKVESEVSLR